MLETEKTVSTVIHLINANDVMCARLNCIWKRERARYYEQFPIYIVECEQWR